MLDLPSEIEPLKALINQVCEENERLKAENERLKAENAELRRRWGLDSTNRHQPPSSDGLQKKPIKPALPKEEGGSQGGQKGHQGKTRRRVENPDRIEGHLPSPCQCCGRTFSSADEHRISGSRQVFDLPEPRLEVTEHRLGQVEGCGVAQAGSYPSAGKGPVQSGRGVPARVTLRSVDHKRPLEQISPLCEDLYGDDRNRATVRESLESGAEHAAPLEEATKARLLEEPVVHFDATGIRVAGKRYGLHTATSAHDRHWFVHQKRGEEALKSAASVLKDFIGTAVHDG